MSEDEERKKLAKEIVNAQKEKEAKDMGIGCLVIIGLIFVGWLWYASGSEEREAKRLERTERDAPRRELSEARVMCRQFVERQLRAPSTARFPATEQRAIRTAQDEFRVTGVVDAQNAFGAMIRNVYSCDIERIEGGRWRLKDLEIVQ